MPWACFRAEDSWDVNRRTVPMGKQDFLRRCVSGYTRSLRKRELVGLVSSGSLGPVEIHP